MIGRSLRAARGVSSRSSLEEHLAKDAKHVWHPYTAAARASSQQMWSVQSAQGVMLEFESGERVIDGMSSWWAAVHGYGNERINSAAKAQVDAFSHVMFGGLTHRPAVELCERLVELAPHPSLQRVFLCDSGSVAIEVAIKMAVQYWRCVTGSGAKHKLLALRGAYHGDTFGAMACCDPVSGMHAELFGHSVSQNLFAPRPDLRFGARPGRDTAAAATAQTKSPACDELERLVAQHAHELAAVIVEPMVQGAGGMWFYDPEVLRRVSASCEKHDVLLIVDEIATGFGRTGGDGSLFASGRAGIRPDIVAVGKALTGGYLSMAATLASNRVALAHLPEAPPLMHGPTFMANPLACAIAGASLELLTCAEYDWRGKVARIEAALVRGLAPCAAFESVKDVRVLGAIGVVELKSDAHDHAQLARAFVEKGLWLRSFKNLVYTMPPFIIEEDQLKHLTDVVCDVLRDLPERP